jgi:hypothetical protein
VSSATFIIVFLCAVSVVGWALSALFLVGLLITRKDRDRWFNGLEGQKVETQRLAVALEQIENLGPHLTADQYGANVAARFAGKPLPYPMPTCKFCGQGDGHWGGSSEAETPPLRLDCPAVIAWRARTGRA